MMKGIIFWNMNSRNSFEILPHTADVRLRVKGETLKDLFEQAVLGMAQILKHNVNIAKSNANYAKRKVLITAPEPTILLIDFLNEVLTASYEEKVVFPTCRVNVARQRGRLKLEAEIFGAKVDGFDEDIKAVTYHEAKIVKNLEGDLEAIITFDI